MNPITLSFWTVVYRTGGWANYRWYYTELFTSFDDAAGVRDAILKGGRPAYVIDRDRLREVGLPVTYHGV